MMSISLIMILSNMILEHQVIELYGQVLFERAKVVPPYKKLTKMQNEACFLYIEEGSYDARSPKERLLVETDESLLMKCGNFLGTLLHSKSSTSYQAVSVHFFPEVLQKVFNNELPRFLQHSKGRSQTIARIKRDQVISKYMSSVLFYFENPTMADEEILSLKLKEIILLLNQTGNAPKIRSILSSLFSPETYSFREVIDTHVYSRMTLKDLADLCNMSLSSFKRMFKRTYQVSRGTYLLNKKLEKSAELLRIKTNRYPSVHSESTNQLILRWIFCFRRFWVRHCACRYPSRPL